MRRLFPNSLEIAAFAVVAIVCAVVVNHSSAADVALAGMAIPVFVAAAILGMRRNPALAPVAVIESEPAREDAV